MRQIGSYVSASGFLLACFVLWWWQEPIMSLKDMISGMDAVSYVSYVLLLAIAVVVMPLTVMPLIPFASSMIGPLATALLSIVGWTLGGVVAFLISRHIGRPVLSRFVDLSQTDYWVAYLKPRSRFWLIVLLRLTLPVDIVSYTLGFSKGIPLLEYTLATLVGVTWFSFAFAYLGNAFLTGNILLIASISGLSIVIFVSAWYFLRKSRPKIEQSE